MKRIITLGWILLTAGCLSAMPVSEKSARTVAENFIRTQEKGNSTLTLIDVLTGPATKTTVEALPAIYVYNIGSEGFIIVSGDDEVTPVLGYSFNGVYNPSQLSPNFAGWLDAYRCDIAAIIETHIAGQKGYHSEKAAREWNALMTGDASIYPKSGRKCQCSNHLGMGPRRGLQQLLPRLLVGQWRPFLHWMCCDSHGSDYPLLGLSDNRFWLQCLQP